MADPRFYNSCGPFSIAEIGRLAFLRLESKIVDGPHSGAKISDVAPLDSAGPGCIAFCDRGNLRDALSTTSATACLVTQKLAGLTPGSAVAIVCDAPQLAFAQIASAFYPTAGSLWLDKRPPLTAISSSAVIGKDTIIAPSAFIGENVEIGDSTIVGPGAVIGHGVSIGSHCKIGPHVTLAYTLIGDRVSIMAGARIGADGFGFTPGPKGLMKIPQLGRVIIQDDVEIGANTCIDRGALTDTVIGEGTKIDNLVQIAHNVRIGRHCVIAAQCGMSGSANIGDFVMMGGQVGVADHVSIASRSQIAGKSGVTKSLTSGQVYGGFPARPVKEWRREVAAVSSLAKKKSSKDE